MKKEFIEAGKIVGTHGLKGEMRVEAWCDSPSFLCKFKTLYLGAGKQPVSVISARPHKNIVIMLIKDINTVEKADAMRGKLLYISRKDIKLDENVYLIQDIIDLEVRDVDTGTVYGKVTDVLKTGANDVYEMKNDAGNTFLIPVIDDIVKEISVDGGYVLISPMKGLFDDEN